MKLCNNIITDTDAYKLTHHLQYPKGLNYMYSYAEARIGSKYPWITFFGLQMVLKDYFVGQVLTKVMIDEAEELAYETFGQNYFNRKDWEYILEKYDGKLPMKIKAVPEGKIINSGNVLFTMESTDPVFAKYLNSMETVLTHVWYPIVVATKGAYILQGVYPYFEKIDATEALPYVINDFGFRGVSGKEEAARGGAAHLLNCVGSDTLIGQRLLKSHYNASPRLQSVLATEHSVATMYGEGDEVGYVRNLLNKDYISENAIISCVGDSYDIFRFAREVLSHPEIKQLLIERPGRFVLRPDSGNPIEVNLELLFILSEVFGYSYINGMKQINHNIGLIQGDGMDQDSIIALYAALDANGWAATNLVVGSGGGLLRKHTRDDISFAIKASYAEFDDGTKRNIVKNPITQTNKKSKTGKLKLVAGYTSGKLTDYMTINHESENFDGYVDNLEEVFNNGELIKSYTFDEVLSNRSIDKFIKQKE